MGDSGYCKGCFTQIPEPDLEDIKRGYQHCTSCKRRLSDLNQIEELITVIEDLYSEIENLRGELNL